VRERYFERRPRHELAGSVVCVWGGFAASGAPRRILPDGCADVIWAPGLEPFVAGPDTAAKLESLPPGPFAGIRFRPGAAAALLGLPASAIRDLRVPLREIWPRAAALRLTDRLEGGEGPGAWLAALDDAVLERAQQAPPPDAQVAAAVARIAAQVGGDPHFAASETGPGERQLRRRFVAAVGYGPKRFARVLRLQRFLALARGAGTARGLAALALAAGYADQPHLSRDCAELAGATPTALLAGRRPERPRQGRRRARAFRP
jgi:AraC-like DNA-binding protein